MRMRPVTTALLLPPLLLALLLTACGERAPEGERTRDSAGTDAALPAPAAGTGSVTGMPSAPGPGSVPLGGQPPAPDPWVEADGRFGLPPLEDEPETGLVEGVPPAPAAPGADPAVGTLSPEADREQAAATVRDYYAAIQARDYPRAYALWSDGGRSSGQSPEQFAAGFASTRSVDLQLGAPGEVEGAAGSRYVEVPVSLTARQDDGSLRRYAGRYVLRRAVVDGASTDQRAWRIASAELREVRL
ncbi:hypothetical protein LDO32_11190 [Luteimonas sp. Y-2-2-4F]|nr:hypothetical protein [Luteimonas sp. Y-2-2-4F]MCD9032289.1 hypothetical protein [Luteimonas sp. Y-2-2-4F]